MKFTEEQKGKMRNFANQLGWTPMRYHHKAFISFFQEMEIEPQVYEIWITNNHSCYMQSALYFQVVLFSTTFDDAVRAFVSKIVKDLFQGDYNQMFVNKEKLSLESVKQYKVKYPDELAKIMVIKDRIVGQTIIFVRTRNSASMLHKALTDDGYEVMTIQGALKQEDRDKIVKEFKDGLTQVLISTDLLARVLTNHRWTFVSVTVYFALAIIISARGCWMYSKKKKSFPEDRESDEFLKKNSEAKETKGTIKFQSRHSQEEIECKTGFLEHLVQAIYQTCAGAVMLTDIVFWCLLVPFLLGDKFQLTLLIGCIHSVNAVFLILDSALNSQPFSWYGLAYFVLWSVSYVVFQWILHACGFTWYIALALVHLPCYGIYVLLMKAKGSIFSRMFPYAFVRTVNTTSRSSLEKKQA